MKNRYEVTENMLRCFFCYELPCSELRPAELDEDSIEYEPYFIQWSDIEALMDNLEKKNPLIGEVYDWWAENVCHLIEAEYLRLLSPEDEDKIDIMRASCMETPENPAEAMNYIILSLVQAVGEIKYYHPEYHYKDFIDFEAMNRDIKLFEEGRYGDAKPVEWSDEKKLFFLQKLNEYDVTEEELKENDTTSIRHFKHLDEVSQEEAEPIRGIVEEMADKGYPQATETIAFSCYEGNSIYGYDEKPAFDLLLELLSLDNEFAGPFRKCIYATLLGNIYYKRQQIYVSINHNETEKRKNGIKAFYFYSLGAIAGYPEAIECLKTMKKRKDFDDMAEDETFRRIIMDRVEQKYHEGLTEEIKDKIEWELDAVARKNQQAFYLRLASSLKNARESHSYPIYTRGGAPFITYLLDINDIDPVRYNISSKMEMGLNGEFSPLIGIYLPEDETIDLDIGDDILLGSDNPPQIEMFNCDFPTLYMIDLMRVLKPETFEDYLRVYALSEGTDVWENNQRALILDGTLTPDMLITTRDDLYEAALKWGLDEETAYKFTDRIRKGRGLNKGDKDLLESVNAPEWAIQVCDKIKFLPSRRWMLSSLNRAWQIK